MPTIFTIGAASARGFGLFGAAAGGPALWSWGNGASGKLGLGNITNYSSPKQVGALVTWSKLAAFYNHSLAVKTDGTLWSWGDNNVGQLGLGNITNYSSPKQVGALTTWATVGGARRFSFAIKTNGTLWAWGKNVTYGQLGLDNLTNYSSPVQVGTLTTWATVDGGNDYWTLAVKTDGTMWSWGSNALGMLGLGNTTNYSSPKQVGALTGWSTVAASTGASSFAIKTNGTMWAWGFGAQGRLGLNSITTYSSPVQIGALTTWSKVAAGNNNGLAAKTDGTLWSWGYNAQGQLGLGNTTTYSSPKQIGALTTWSTVTSGSYSLFALKTDGTLWSWAGNGSGQLGLGNVLNKSSPNQVGALTTWSAVSAGLNFTLAIKT